MTQRVRGARSFTAGLAAWLLYACACLYAQAPQTMVPHAGLPPLRTVSPAEYRSHLDQLRHLVADCSRVITQCEPERVGDMDDFVHPAHGPDYVERYGWLRELLADRNDPSHSKRTELLPHAEQRLAEQEAELDGTLPDESLTAAQRSARSAVLGRKEFRTTQDYSISERLEAWFSRLIAKLFGGVSTLGRIAPWLGQALQWGALLLAAILLLLWVWRALDRQRVALGRLHGDASREAQHAESRAWAEQARAHAEGGEWRDAVHCLYWASIVALEDRRTLRPSLVRTPREALRLIDVASQMREPLQAQTGEFERIWYGLQPAVSGDYETALGHYQTLRGQAFPGAKGAKR